MGTYLNISIKNATNEKAHKFNALWKGFSKDLIDPKLPENFYEGKVGNILEFYTNEDFEAWALDSIRNQNLSHLGITKTASAEEAKALLRKHFGKWTSIGHAEIKLSGSHYCFHILERIKQFLQDYEDELEYDDEDGSLDRFIDYKEAVITSSYCKECALIAKKLGIKLPIYPGANCKNSMHSKRYNLYEWKIKKYLQAEPPQNPAHTFLKA